jgi:hypothetical protein
MTKSDEGGRLLWALVFLFLYVTVAKSGGCSPSDERLQGAMRSEGFQDVSRKGYDFFECGYGDVWVESFRAKRPEVVEAGKPLTRVLVEGTLCCGILKGCTIRWP